jgi:hypothetical protein
MQPQLHRAKATPLTQMWRGVIAFAALLLLGGVAAAFLFPKAMPWHHRADIGKPIGVPERSTSLPPQNSAMTAANQPQAPPPAPAASTADQPAPVEERQERTTTVTAVADPPERIATATRQDSSHGAAPEGQESTAKAESHQPLTSASRTIAENATRTPPTAEQSEAAPLAEAVTSHAKSERTTAASETKTPGEVAHDTSTTAPTRRSDSSKRKSRVAKVEEKPPKAIAIDPALAAEEDEAIRRAGQVRAQFVGTSGDGRLLLRLPSGQIVTVTPRNEQEHAVEPRRHRRPTEPEDYPRAQPVNPDDEQPRD